MKEERIKQLMTNFGMPNNIVLMTLIEQVANEVEQEVLRKYGIDVWNTKQSCNETEDPIETCTCSEGCCRKNSYIHDILHSKNMPKYDELDDKP